MKNFWVIAGVVVILLVASVWWSRSNQSEDSSIIAARGLHWHPELEIYVNGERQEIPQDLGIGLQYASAPTYDPAMRMTAMHTHTDLPLIHLEFQRVVRREDTRLGNLFTIWDKDFMEFGNRVTMMVNGVENTKLGDYEMNDGDKIVLNYTK